jgi:hypothetical protein
MNSECSICYELTRFSLLCNHSFCLNCILHWCEINSNCPMCRHEISDDEIQDSYLIYKIKTHDNNKAKELLNNFFNSIGKYNFVSYTETYLNLTILIKLLCICIKIIIPWDENVYMYKKTFSQSQLSQPYCKKAFV